MRFLAAIAFCTAALAQSGPVPPSFESVSIRPAAPGQQGDTRGASTIVLVRRSLQALLTQAYPDVKSNYQISAPAWLDEDRFDIIARFPEGATAEDVPQMLQGLLAERFHAHVHWETKPLDVYVMGLEKGGAKMAPTSTDAPTLIHIDAGPQAVEGTQGDSKPRRFNGAMTMGRLAELLTGALDRPVIDMTELTGRFDIEFSFTPEPGSIFTSLPEQLGLNLEARTLPLKVLIVDSIERTPSDR